MRTSLLTRAAAIPEIAATTALAVTGAVSGCGAAASTSASAKTLPTSLSIHVDPSTIRHGQKTVVDGVLTSGQKGLADEVVHLYWAAAGKKFTEKATSNTAKTGAFAFKVTAPANRLCLLVFNGTSKFSASRSRVVALKVT
jgi:hypothetical protein